MAKVLHLPKKDWYQLKISLNNIKPEVWRRFLIQSDIKLPDLHKAIQTVMGWTNSHLHQFIIDGKFYSEPDDESFAEIIDYRKIRLYKVLTEEKQTINYEYDFGDGWEHTITLEKVLTDSVQKYPVCLEGKRSCPPEDCGGPYGYEDLLKIISNPEDEEYTEMIEWLGDGFDPEYFDKDDINDLLKERDYGCITLD